MKRIFSVLIFFLFFGGIFSFLFPPFFCLADESDVSVIAIPGEEEEGGGGLPIESYNPPQPPETGFSILINNNAEEIDILMVTLNLLGSSDTTKMAISNSADFKDASQEIYTPTKIWDLCNGLASCPEGEYTVFAKFYTSWGVASKIVSDNIIYKKPSNIGKVIDYIQEKTSEIVEHMIEKGKQIIKSSEKNIITETPPIEPVKPEEILKPETSSSTNEAVVEEEDNLTTDEKSPTTSISFLEKTEVQAPSAIRLFSAYIWQIFVNFWQKIINFFVAIFILISAKAQGL